MKTSPVEPASLPILLRALRYLKPSRPKVAAIYLGMILIQGIAVLVPQLIGRLIDPLVSRKHREHHLDPRDTELVFIPTPVLLWLILFLYRHAGKLAGAGRPGAEEQTDVG